MRVREVDIHHADLGAGYTPADWPEDFRVLLLESMTKRPYPAPFSVRPTDLDRTWHYGDGCGSGPSSPVRRPRWAGGSPAAAPARGSRPSTRILPEVESW